ncbi:unnamed protein product [Chondrus crispus]|uniref:Uncharacterized protein n=1 Tax=Chondrus crispus TaxID=2769 RepID=R7QQ68_CHOCR|nr:unnamed protein product [Chondrus crispus]CDF40269.1 unnamed protein product [Chondrus crispus]|eukprot:XP_005710563.1 unnamed protein product [Chondrus crispus]
MGPRSVRMHPRTVRKICSNHSCHTTPRYCTISAKRPVFHTHQKTTNLFSRRAFSLNPLCVIAAFNSLLPLPHPFSRKSHSPAPLHLHLFTISFRQHSQLVLSFSAKLSTLFPLDNLVFISINQLVTFFIPALPNSLSFSNPFLKSSTGNRSCSPVGEFDAQKLFLQYVSLQSYTHRDSLYLFPLGVRLCRQLILLSRPHPPNRSCLNLIPF